MPPTPSPIFAAGDAIDCHAHIVGPASAYPFAADRSYTPETASLAQYGAVMARLGASGFVMVQPSFYGNDNRCTLDAAHALGRACTVAVVAADTGASELRRLQQAGVRGLRLNHVQPGFDAQGARAAQGEKRLALAPFVAMARTFGFHLQLFQAPEVWPDLLEPLDAGGVTWVLDHVGMVPAARGIHGREFRAVCEAMRSPRGWIKLSGFYRMSALADCADVRPLVERLYDIAPERCVWGSDWPHTQTERAPDTAAQLKSLLDWLPDDAARRRVLVDNPQRLYGLAPS